jgi:RNA polymerase sigma-70 factor (ECF subfamily)
VARWAEPELVSAALAGGEAAAERLVAAIWPACFRLAAAVIGDRALAQDAAQEACVIVHRKIGGLRSIDAFDAWVYRIVLREAPRIQRRRPRVAQPLSTIAAGVDQTTSLDVWRALDTLAPELREVIVLFYFDDLTSAEVAAVLRIPHPTVRTRLARARERLRGDLEDYRDEPASNSLEVNAHAV